MQDKAAVVTGIAGGIGSAIGEALRHEGWYVVGIDLDHAANQHCDALVPFDLAKCGDSAHFETHCVRPVHDAIGERRLVALVNNAAIQRLDRTGDIRSEDWHASLAVNLTAPLLLSQALLSPLTSNRGVILNIGSVHAVATKKAFVTYATTKSALHGLTRALAVDLGPDVRVACLAPAAVSTPMLNAGFAGQPEAFADLERCHPMERIASPSEVADAARFLLSDHASFFSGGVLFLDGGVLSRLHDPA